MTDRIIFDPAETDTTLDQLEALRDYYHEVDEWEDLEALNRVHTIVERHTMVKTDE